MRDLVLCPIERKTHTHDEDREDNSERVLYRDLVDVDDEHLSPYEREDKCESNRQITKPIDDACEGEVERAESHDSEYIGRIDDELVLSDREDRWDTIDREYEISRLDKYETHEEWSTIEDSFLSDEERISMEFFLKWDDLSDPLDDETLLWIDFHLSPSDQLVGCIEEDSTEYIDNPVKILEKRYSREDEYHSEKYSSEYSPEEDLVLIRLGYSEVGEYDREDEYIIYGECLFYHISREEFECFLLSEPVIDESVEYQCERYPYTRPGERFFHTHFCALAMEYSEIEREHEEDKYIEPYPEPNSDFHNSNGVRR
jgi:hypothetical protein